MSGHDPFVAVLVGSDSDLPVMRATVEVLQRLEIPCELRITSAHRTPHATHEYVRDADARGCAVFVAAAGLAAHLAGAVAGLTCKPVIGVPIDAGPLSGIDALLSTVQMPAGIPVATVAIGRTGAKNAAYLAAQMLAIANQELGRRLADERRSAAAAVIAKNEQNLLQS